MIWGIILVGAILVHSLSDYQNAEQANRPTLLKALDVLYVLWQAQQKGAPVSEVALLRDGEVIVGRLDGESWRLIRDQLMDARIITQNSNGYYLLSKDLNAVTFDQLKKIINAELPIATQPVVELEWQKTAQRLLQQQRAQQQQLLAMPLTELFKQPTLP